MADLPILPGSTVVVRDGRSIYNGYRGFVQRITGTRVLTGMGAPEVHPFKAIQPLRASSEVQ